MISRQTSFALAFACLATLSVTVAKAHRDESALKASPATVQVIQLPRVVVTGKVNRSAQP